jgi:hypothetical protein
MKNFCKYINSIEYIQLLEQLKEKIKDEVIRPDHNWQSRLILYKKVQLITERIDCLQNHTHNHFHP